MRSTEAALLPGRASPDLRVAPTGQAVPQAKEVERLGVDVFGEMLKSRGSCCPLVEAERLVGYEGHMTVKNPVFEELDEV